MGDFGQHTRRSFLKSSSLLTGASLLKIGTPSLLAITQAACSARDDAASYKLLGEEEAADIIAIAARIIPTTDTPGATEAGVVHFFDRALAAEMQFALAPMRAGLADLNKDRTGGSHFANLDTTAQDALLTSIESSSFFGMAWLFTMIGFFAMSEHGGNKNHVAWDAIGFEGNNGAWQYPFGFYDAEYAKEHNNGG